MLVKTTLSTPDPENLFETTYDFSKDGIRHDILTYLDTGRENLKICDIGCATGKTLKYLLQNLKNPELYGVEPDKNLTKDIPKDIKIFNLTCEDFLKINKEKFDYIIMADVVEHLFDPWNTLFDLREHLLDSGSLLLSIPNVQNINVILNLLNGRFPYASNDIVNKFHIRFFTYYEILEMLIYCGFKIVNIGANFSDMTTEIAEICMKLRSMFPSKYQYFEVYQFVIEAKKDDNLYYLHLKEKRSR